MNLGRKLLIIGAIIIGASYAPVLFMIFGYSPSFLLESPEDSGVITISVQFTPLLQFAAYAGFALLIAGATFRFWKRK